MKKLISLFAAASMLTLSAVAVQAEEAEAKTMANHVPTNNVYSFEYSGLKAGEYYGMVAVEGEGAGINTTDVSKFVYIDQKTADSTGKISFSNFAPKGVTPSDANYKISTVFIGGAGLNGAQAIGILREAGWEEKTDIVISVSVLDAIGAKPVEIIVKDASGSILANTPNIDENGIYSISVPAGVDYSVVITKDGYLTFTYTNVDAEESLTLPETEITNLAGDVDENTEIKAPDLKAVLDNFNKTTADGVDSRVDVDGNTEIKAPDLKAVLDNFNNSAVTQALPEATPTN